MNVALSRLCQKMTQKPKCTRRLRNGSICGKPRIRSRMFCGACTRVVDPSRIVLDRQRRLQRKRAKEMDNDAPPQPSSSSAATGGVPPAPLEDSDVEIVAEKTLDEVLRERTEENKRTGRFIDLTL